MNLPTPIQAADLMSDLKGKLEEITSNDTVFLVATEEPLFNGANEFVLAPSEICGAVLGLIDEEYGWPDSVSADEIKELRDLTPGPRRHPFIERNGRPIAVGILTDEFEKILERQAKRRQDD